MSATDYHLIPEYSRMSLFERAQMFNDGFSPSTDPSQFPAAAKIFLEGIPIGTLNEQEMINKIRKLMTISTELRSFFEVVIEQIKVQASTPREMMSAPRLPRYGASFYRPTIRASTPLGERNSAVLGNARVTKSRTNRNALAVKFAERIEASTRVRDPISKVFEGRYAAWAAEQTRKVNAGESFDDDEDNEDDEDEEEVANNFFPLSFRSSGKENRVVRGVI